MKRKNLYWVNGEYVTTRKARRIQKRTGTDCFSFQKSVYQETLSEKINKIIPWVELACVLGIFVSLMYMFS